MIVWSFCANLTRGMEGLGNSSSGFDYDSAPSSGEFTLLGDPIPSMAPTLGFNIDRCIRDTLNSISAYLKCIKIVSGDSCDPSCDTCTVNHTSVQTVKMK